MSRRGFLQQVSALGAGAALGLPLVARAEPPPEVQRIRLLHAPSICLAPQLLAEELLRLEGFTDIQYVEINGNRLSGEVANGRVDLTQAATPEVIPEIDAGSPIVVLAGIHAGCYELFAHEQVRRITDLKGMRVVISGEGSPEQTYVASIAAYVGLKPGSDIRWIVAGTSVEAMQMFVDGQADAFLAFPPQPQELRAGQVGHVLVNTTRDRPWSQYFCCVAVANQEFVNRHPVAAKRALRAMLKATDLCAEEPERVARYLVNKKYESRYEIALEVVNSLPYRRWRDSHPEDTLRFHALRLHDVGMIKSSPQAIIANGTDWRFLDELRKELKA